jgi:IS5 family transposase
LYAKYGQARVTTEMDQVVVPWADLVQLIEPYSPKAGAADCRLPWRRCCASASCNSWFALSDPAMEDALRDVPMMREFAGRGDWVVFPPEARSVIARLVAGATAP